MQISSADLRGSAFAKPNPNRRILSLAIVATLHIVAVWAIITGLYQRKLIIPAGPIHVIKVPETVEPPHPMPPVHPDSFVVPSSPPADAPVFDIQRETIATVTRTIDPPPTHPEPELPRPTPLEAIAATHTIPPYPEIAIRLQQHGTVVLRLEIDGDGLVTSAAIAESSGSSTLDDAAVAWVKSHWRYRAATDAGKPIASTTLAAVKFDLRNAR